MDIFILVRDFLCGFHWIIIIVSIFYETENHLTVRYFCGCLIHSPLPNKKKKWLVLVDKDEREATNVPIDN